MTDPTESYIAQADRYFSRTAISNPAYIGPDHIAVLDNSSGTKQLGLFTLSTGDLSPLTGYGEGVITLLGSPASGRIVYGIDRSGNERQQLYAISRPGEDPARLTTTDTAFHEPGVLSGDGDAVIYRSNARDEAAWDIVVTDLRTGESETWLEDGGQVTATALDTERALVIRNNGNMDMDLLLVERGGAVRNLTEHDGEQWVYAASFSKGGEGVWMLSNIDREFVALIYQDLESGKRRVVYETGWDVELFAVSPDESAVAIAVNEDGVSRVSILMTSDRGDMAQVETPRGVVDGFSWSPDSQAVVFGISTMERPSCVMRARRNGSVEVLIDADEDDPPATVAPALIRYPTWDGREVPAFFLRPQGDGPFPVLVEIHGGPEGQRRPDYGNNGASLQFITSLGIGVLALNIRGSTGYGKEYAHLDDREKRLDALKDVECAVRWLREQDDVVRDTIAVYGISYGGFMTLSALTRLPELWAAGVEMVGMAHLGTFLERTGPWRRRHREGEYGSLERDREMLEQISPLPLVDRIAAPMMVFHGRQDARVPLYESEQIVDAVRKRGLDVVFQVYDDEGHVFTKRQNLVDAFGRIGEFLARHLWLVTAA